MKRLAVLLIFCAIVNSKVTGQGQSGKNNDVPTIFLQRANNLWGPNGFARISGQNFQIGCIVSATGDHIMWQSKNSFEDAFDQVDLLINGPRIVTAVATDTSGNSTESEPVLSFICNK